MPIRTRHLSRTAWLWPFSSLASGALRPGPRTPIIPWPTREVAVRGGCPFRVDPGIRDGVTFRRRQQDILPGWRRDSSISHCPFMANACGNWRMQDDRPRKELEWRLHGIHGGAGVAPSLGTSLEHVRAGLAWGKQDNRRTPGQGTDQHQWLRGFRWGWGSVQPERSLYHRSGRSLLPPCLGHFVGGQRLF